MGTYLVSFSDNRGRQTIRINEDQKDFLDWFLENDYLVNWEDIHDGAIAIIPEGYIKDLTY